MPSSNSESFAVRGNRGGYCVVGWANSNFAYFAASDIDRNVLDALQDSLSEAVGSRVVTAEELS